MEDLFDFSNEEEVIDFNQATGEIIEEPKTEYSPEEMTNEQYHSSDAISKSSLDLLLKSPYHLKNKNSFRYDSPAFLIGSALHKLVLEPETFYEEFYTDKKVEGSTIGKQFLKPDDMELISNMAQAVMRIKESVLFLKDGKAEYSYFSELEGVKVRCRPDYYNEKLGIAIDLKTCNDASAYGFQSSVAKFNYHMQDAMYTDILKSLGKKVNYFLFIAVEKKAPHMVGFYVLDHVAQEEGRKKYKELLNLYKHCEKTNNWWGYSDFNNVTGEVNAVQTLTLPTWAFYK